MIQFCIKNPQYETRKLIGRFYTSNMLERGQRQTDRQTDMAKLIRELFLSGEGVCNRRYGRTAALRLIMQPYYDDEDYFLSFS
jgi:hypothetical protein